MRSLLSLFILALLLTLAPAARAQTVAMDTYVQNTDEGFILYVDNREAVPITVNFELDLVNAEADRGNDFTAVVPARVEAYAVDTIRVTDLYDRSAVSAATSAILGDFLTVGYDTNHVYTLPFAKGTSHRVFQGYHGKFTHQNDLALDFDLRVGTPVHAARGGVVADVVVNHDRNCSDPSCMDYNNFITVYHDDGTFANYAHLKHKGSVVAEGDTVRQGQHIGYSGATGFTNGPHLHFVVYMPRQGEWASLPTYFAIGDGRRRKILEEGGTYRRNYTVPSINQ